MRSYFRFLALALAVVASFVAAESELAHAMEVIYMYSKYQTEGQVYNSGYWIAADCQKNLNRRCTFNEFVSYLKFGNRQTGPSIIDLNGQFNWMDRDTVQRVATRMAGLRDPTDGRGERLYMAGDMPANRVISNTGGITALYNKFQKFDNQVAADIAKMTDETAKNNAQKSLDTSNNQILKAANDLRIATRRQKLYDEMIKKFSPTGRLDKVYEYEKDGKTMRFDPIQWVVEKKTVWGREFQSINFDETKKKNPQLNDPILMKRVEEHLALFNSDGSDGRGKGLINYDVRYPGTNGRHQHIINMQAKVGQAYGKSC